MIGQKDTFHGKAHLWLDNRQHTWRRIVDGAAIAPVSGNVQVNLGRADASVQAEWFSTATGLSNNTQNLYAMSTAGTQLWLRQNFRGTQVIDLATSTARGVSAEIRNRDGGTFNFDVVYKDSGNPIGRPQTTALGRSGPVIVNGRVFIAEDWGVTAIEHRP